MAKHIEIEDIAQHWTEIYYHPEPIITVAREESELNYWKEAIPNCTIEYIPENLGWMKDLSRGVGIKIIYPENHTEMYVEPLAKIHKVFFDRLSAVIFEVYPFKGSGKSMTKFELGGKVHSIIAAIYWDLNYKNYTPINWVLLLNAIIDHVEYYPVKSLAKIDHYLQGVELEKFKTNLLRLINLAS